MRSHYEGGTFTFLRRLHSHEIESKQSNLYGSLVASRKQTCAVGGAIGVR